MREQLTELLTDLQAKAQECRKEADKARVRPTKVGWLAKRDAYAATAKRLEAILKQDQPHA